VDVQAKYLGYIDRQNEEIERQRRNEETLLPESLDYAQVHGLSNEARRQHRRRRRAAARIPGSRPRRSRSCSFT
jgi:tRNA uridine 5-carboxymethylaminomethyl modification enzyme